MIIDTSRNGALAMFLLTGGLLWFCGCNAGEANKQVAKSGSQTQADGLQESSDDRSTKPNRSAQTTIQQSQVSPPLTGTVKPESELNNPVKPIQPRIKPPIQPRIKPPIQSRIQPPPIQTIKKPSIQKNTTIAEGTTGPAIASASNQIQTNDEGQTSVEVFYVTDRKSVIAISKGDFLKAFKWPLIVVIIATVLGFWSITQRRLIPGLVAALVLLAGLSTGYSAMIHWQRVNRLADNNDVRYTAELKNITPDQDSLDYGRCLVNIPPDHRVGTIDSPSLQRFEFSEDARKHVILERVIRGTKDDFFSDLNQRLESGNGHTFVFIHGYNVSFDNAVKRTAQISFDLKFGGVPICYSWPSRGELEDYTRDMANADWTVIHLQEFLTSLFDETGAKRIHLIAHSMGNRALMQALDRMALQWGHDISEASSLASGSDSQDGESIHELLKRTEMPLFGQIIMAAPDIGADEFRQRYASTLRKLSNQITLYASSRDRALMVSTSVHGQNRAGLAGKDIVVVDGIDTIDVSQIDTSLIGHSYYGDNPAMIDDLRALIQLSRTTSERDWLEQVKIASDKVYWKFR